ncbi:MULTISPECIES: zinc-dependent alcohol dehydrogenase family protein [unclassified Duganella]|uniref:zinc-dependent alcohol dehydrogenase family protein n=1 Tax=unclassified Duganella TaxID=2636909 RepID=UPI0006FE019C|nr:MULTISPECIES: zinc-dependent alcohol dehydrogenase family protein [unclassified Duganella]KQV42912.1 quinone oxidoreductase [Duganella sp. Root336D2]KRB97037.1 quinone oxidoreductase [Duganella sp. Root198D2]
MKAMILEAAGKPLILGEIAKPSPAAGQVLVRIHASGVNPLDLKIAAGQAGHARMPLPAVLGIDMAGAVEAVGPDVSGFAPGDAVFGMTGGVGGVQGSLAEYAAVDASLLALAPRSISLREAAALPLVFITAWEGLVDRARVKAGDSVLVQGGAGGVGRMAVQLALAHGAVVSATGRPAQRELIEAMGARFIEQAEGEEFDIVYDTVGGEVLDASFRAARQYGGHVVSSLGWGTHALAPLSFRAATYSGVFTLLPLLSGKGRAAHGAILREAARLVDAGKLKVQLNPGRFALAEVNQAHAAAGGGKVVVDIG